MFKKAAQLSDLELRAAVGQLAEQVGNLEKVMVSVIGMLLAAHDELSEPPPDVFIAMVESMTAYTAQVCQAHDALDRLYEREIASQN